MGDVASGVTPDGTRVTGPAEVIRQMKASEPDPAPAPKKATRKRATKKDS